jgi:hypothetical protein
MRQGARTFVAIQLVAVTLSCTGAAADHVDVMRLMADDAPMPSLDDADSCLLEANAPRSEADMSAQCLYLFESCWSRIHRDPARGSPAEQPQRVLLGQCFKDQSSRDYSLLLKHELAVADAFPRDKGEDARAEALGRLVRAPQDAVSEASADCLRASGGEELALLSCAAQWRRDTLVRSRLAWREEAR